MNCVANPAQTSYITSTLGTPDPHYIPGYVGYVPQAKYRPGHTYGITTHRVLLDPCIHMSPRSVLNNIYPDHCTDDFGRPGLGADSFLQAKMALVNTRVNSFGRQQYLPDMTPGYAGFVPRFQTILGHTYSPACNRALARFEQDQWRDRLFNKELEALDGWRFCYKSKPWESPEIIREDGGDLQEFPRQPCQGQRPIQQCNTVSQPRTGCGCAGTNSPAPGSCCESSRRILTPDKSICEYGDRRIWGKITEQQSSKTCGLEVRINPNAYMKPINRLQTIYRDCEGMLPNYQGHVPGATFRVGKTYGASTQNAKKEFSKSVRAPVCYPVNRPTC